MGIPMLCCPSFTDQCLNRTFICQCYEEAAARLSNLSLFQIEPINDNERALAH